MTRIVTIGGGTGHYMLLCALGLIPKLRITSVVSMADSGGSSGRLRDKYGALPPGDVLQCLLALSTWPGDVARRLLRYRFTEGSLDGDNAGNWLLTVLHQKTGSFVEAIRYMEQILRARKGSRVLPVTVGDITLHGRSRKGRVIDGEAEFDRLKKLLDADDQIIEAWLEPNSLVLEEAAGELGQADFIVLSPGDLFSSVIPALLVQGMREALALSRARIIYVCNMVTTRGQTDGFEVPDFVEALERYLPRRIDAVCYHADGIDIERVRRYVKKDMAYPVEVGEVARLKGRRLIPGDYLSESNLMRHAPRKLAAALRTLLRVAP